VSKKVSVIISNRNDTVMLSITIRSCLEALTPFGNLGEVIVCDNSDPEIYKSLNSYLATGYIRDKKLKIFRQDFHCLFTARETAIEHSQGEYIVCVDSHMILGHNMIVDLVNFMERHSNNNKLAFAHAPINWLNHHERSSKHDRDMSVNELGNWNKSYKTERKITWKGMPWICRREWFLDRKNGLNGYGALRDHKISWGGGDMHIGIKPWLLGYENWAVPCRPAIHIGPFPKNDYTKKGNEVTVSNGQGYKYRLWSNSGYGPHTFGFLVSCYVLGGEKMMSRNKAAIKERFGRFINVDKWWQKAMELGHEEKQWLDARKKMSFEQLLETQPWNHV